MNKNYLRNEYMKIRNSINSKDIKSKIIIEKILNLEEYKQAKVVCVYSSLNFEVNTDLLINRGIKDRKVIAVPKVIDDDIMEFYKINSIKDLKDIGSFGIREPLNECKNLIKKDDINLIIIPGICFDKNKNRIGFGKGYYDKYLSDIPKSTIKIGICFNEQLLTNHYIDVTENDIKMDIVITDKKIII